MSLADYLAFAGRHRRFLAFGFLLSFTSSAGQTFFIGLFGPAVRTTFELSHTEWGSLYLVGTLASALFLPWTGQLIDRFDLRLYVSIALLGLAGACFAMSMAPPSLFSPSQFFFCGRSDRVDQPCGGHLDGALSWP